MEDITGVRRVAGGREVDRLFCAADGGERGCVVRVVQQKIVQTWRKNDWLEFKRGDKARRFGLVGL